MSIEIMTQVMASNVPGLTRRAVLLMLANNANSEGLCWPSIGLVADQLDVSERTVQRAIGELEETGIVSMRRRAGRSTVFMINRDAIRARPPREPKGDSRSTVPSTGDTVTPRQSVTPGGVRVSGVKSVRGDRVSALTPDTLTGGGDTVSPRTVKNQETKTSPSLRSGGATPKGARLPDDWQPDPSLKTWARENCPALLATPGAGTIETEKFRDYWAGMAGARGRKLDWAATWRNWMRKADQDATSRRPGSALAINGAIPALSPRDAKVAGWLQLGDDT